MKLFSVVALLFLSLSTFAQQQQYTVHFSTASFTLTTREKQELNELMDFFASDSIINVKVSFAGHTDSVGSEEANLSLSEKRVEAVRNFLNIPSSWETSTTFSGEQTPAASNQSESGRAQNRRVEVVWKYTIKKPKPNTDTAFTRQDTILTAVDTVAGEVSALPDTTTEENKGFTPETMPYVEVTNKSMQKLRKGKRIRFENIEFIPGSTLIMPGSYGELDQLLYIMVHNPTLEIEIRGHVCCLNDQAKSIGRARTVRDFLLKNGIDKKRMEVRGFGNRRPRNLGLTPEGKQRNRRVEIKILDI